MGGKCNIPPQQVQFEVIRVCAEMYQARLDSGDWVASPPKIALKLSSWCSTHGLCPIFLSNFIIKTQISDHFPLLSAHSSAPPHLFDSPNNKQWGNNLFWGNNMWCCVVCLQTGCHFLQTYEVWPALSLSPASLSLLMLPENGPGTRFNSITVFFFFFSSSTAVSFPPLCLPHSNFTVVVPPLSFSFSFSLSICLPGADDQLSWSKGARVVPGCLSSILAERDTEDGIREVL